MITLEELAEIKWENMLTGQLIALNLTVPPGQIRNKKAIRRQLISSICGFATSKHE